MDRPYRKIDITPDSLLGCRFFDDMERSERALIARYCEGRCYRPRAEVVRYGDMSRDVFFILSGRVQATVLTSDGKTVTFQQLVGGGMFGELSAIDSESRSTDVVAVEETSVLRISGPSFKDLVAQHPVLAERTMLRLCALSRFLCDRFFVSHAYSVPAQIALEICRIVSAHDAPQNLLEIDPAPSHEEIGRRVGTNREQVTRVVAPLKERGLLEQSRRRWWIPNVAALLEALPHPPHTWPES